METVKLIIPGMKNSQAILKVDRVIADLPGAEPVKIDPGIATIKLDGVSKESVIKQIENMGFKVSHEVN